MLDIVVLERLFCADYRTLNDPFEGILLTALDGPQFDPNYFNANNPIARQPGKQPNSLSRPQINIQGSVDSLGAGESDIRNVCSLSQPLDEVLLWSHYADQHRGVAIELDIEKSDLVAIKYVPEAQVGVEIHSIVNTPSKEILSYKAINWKYEGEHRIIQEGKYFSVKGRVKGVFVGHRATEHHIELLKKVVPDHIPLHRTELKHDSFSIQRGPEIQRE